MPPPVTEEELRLARPVLLGFARRALGPAEVVKDLVQETLLAAVAGAAPFEGKASLRTWLVGILSRKIIDHLRRQKRDRLFVDAPDEALLLSDAPARAPDQRAEQRAVLAAIERALPGLPEGERLAVLLVDVEGLGHPEACNAMAVKPTHLRVLLHRGRHRLRKAVEDAGL